MLKSYMTMAWRNLAKNRISSIINIGGLAVGLASAVLVMIDVLDEFSYDHFHAGLKNICLVMKNQQQLGGISTGMSTAGPLAPAMRAETPETKFAARTSYESRQMIKISDKTLFISGMYAEPDFLRIMSFPALTGDPVEALNGKDGVVLTERCAQKLFGTGNPMGKVLILNSKHPLRVRAILRDPPENSSIRFDMLIPFQVYESENNWLSQWDNNQIQTWAELKPGADPLAVNRKITRMLQERSNDNTVSLFTYPLERLRLFGSFDNGKPNGGKIYTVGLLGIFGLFILLIACINFMNLATARSEHRAREVGVRKVLGSSRKKLILQFFCEALLLTFFALALGLVLAKLSLPYVNRLLEKKMLLRFGNWQIWACLLGVGIFTGLVAGSYPAIYLSRFKAVRVIKGMLTTRKQGSGLRRMLVTFQFIISVFFIIGTLVIYAQIQYVRNRPIGYEQENLVDLSGEGSLGDKFDIFKNELARVPGIRGLSGGSDNILSYGAGITGMDWPGKLPGQEISVLITGVQYDWAKTMGIRMLEGRDFNPAFVTDSSACLINQTTVEKMGLQEPVVGIKIGGKTVIGVFRNFVFNNPSGIIAPMAVYLQKTGLGHIYVRFQNDGRWRQTLARIGQIAKKLNPGYPFSFSFVREDYQHRFEEFNAYGSLAAVFGGMAIFISCLGLFGLSAFLAEKRSKEMSIRKVLGASVKQVWFSLSKDFLKPVAIAILVVIPCSVWILEAALRNIAYHVSLSWWMFALAGFLAIFVALATVSFQGFKTAWENPAGRLRTE
jgi:putative ABC transport system permease protein